MKQLVLFLLTTFVAVTIFAQGSESFTNLPPNSSSCAATLLGGRQWLTWTSQQCRTDQMINGRTITVEIEMATLSATTFPMAAERFALFSYQQTFTTAGAVWELFIDGISRGSVATSHYRSTASFPNINVAATLI